MFIQMHPYRCVRTYEDSSVCLSILCHRQLGTAMHALGAGTVISVLAEGLCKPCHTPIPGNSIIV